MKKLHRHDLFCWSAFNAERNIDFHSLLWVREAGNVLIDPLPLPDHDWQHLQSLGGAKHIVVTNSDHVRDAERIAAKTNAVICGPIAEKTGFPILCQRWLGDGEEIVVGLDAYQLHGSKTPGELALILEGTTLITGDLIRCHVAGELCLLPDAKLENREMAIKSVKRIAGIPGIETVLVGDGWPVFKCGAEELQRLALSL